MGNEGAQRSVAVHLGRLLHGAEEKHGGAELDKLRHNKRPRPGEQTEKILDSMETPESKCAKAEVKRSSEEGGNSEELFDAAVLIRACVLQEQGNLLELVCCKSKEIREGLCAARARKFDLCAPSLGSDYSEEEAMMLLNLALLCTSLSPSGEHDPW
ncbi:hypothetical protein Droror1_Dr00027596 [Drosera rotundifolia]